MKQMIWLVLASLSITGSLCAQDFETIPEKRERAGAQKAFEPDPEKITRIIWIDLGKGNKLRFELGNINDLDDLTNIDSLLMVFLNDMRPFKDSLNDPLVSHRIDYVTDLSGRKRIRLIPHRPIGSSYLLDNNEAAIIRLEQDTVNMMVLCKPQPFPRWQREVHYSRLTFIVNRFDDLQGYVTGGLNAKVSWLSQNMNTSWIPKDGKYMMEKDPTITAAAPKGSSVAVPGNDYISSATMLGLGNYKTYFTPSFAAGFALHFRKPGVMYEVDVLWEPTFIFQTNDKGHLQTYRNDFLTLSYLVQRKYGISLLRQLVHLSPSVSLGYLIRRQGEFYDKNTFRLGVGGLRFYDGNLTFEPCFFFNNFFQQATPGLKVALAF